MDTTPEATPKTPIIDYDNYNVIKPPGWCAPKGIDKEKIAALREKGLSITDIARIVGCAKQTVFYHLHNMDVEQEQIEEYKTNRADYLAGMQLRLLASITPEDVRKMQPGSRILGACQLFDKERLERGLATSHEKMIVLQVPRSEEEYKKIIENINKSGDNEVPETPQNP